jgi:hypothetical protein
MSLPSKKPRKSKSKKINVSARQKWESILRSVTKEEVPIGLLESLTVNLLDGTKVFVNVKELLETGKDPRDIEDHINSRLSELKDMIVDVDFFISIDKVSQTVLPMTNKILKNI